ncbi:MAG TPA: ATP-binding protein [Ktedonobacteraceae bacterium]|nr:ATP-binding protein [Ktedonobacteraceae bacterium]
MSLRRSAIQGETTVTDALTLNYLRKLSRQNYIATAIFIFISVFSLLWLVFQIGGTTPLARATVLVFYSNSMYAFVSFIGAFWCFQTAYRARRGPVILAPRYQRAWLLIGLGLLANGIGGVVYTYLEDYVMKNPVPSPADFFFTLFYILTFAGLFMLPIFPKSRQSLMLIVLDTLITTLCLLDVSWFFVLRPIFSSFTNLGQLYVAASYPFWDILLILAIIMLIYQRTRPMLNPLLVICGLGILAQIGADTLYALTIPSNTYNTGTWYIDTFWFIGYLLIGLSAPYQYASIARSAYREREHAGANTKRSRYTSINNAEEKRDNPFLSGSLVYIPILVLIIVILYSEFAHIENSFLIVIATMVVLLLTLRFVFSNYQNETLLTERDRRREESDMLRMLTAQLTEEIQLDTLLTRIVSIATTTLGFEAAALLLLETRDQAYTSHFSLLVRAATDALDSHTTWQIEGEQFPYNAILAGKQIEVYWPEASVELPEELERWQTEQHILSTLFIPLATQGKTIGCLALSSRVLPNFDERQAYMASAFAEQAARTIEHARLYEEAREHELFAQALATVAARLNSAAANGTGVGTEIQQLICTEGARALQADYAVLYMPAQNKVLLPVAVESRDEEATGSVVGDWPPIRSHTPEYQALKSLQPELMAIDDLSSSGYLPAVSGPLPAVPISVAQQSLVSRPPLSVPSGGLRGRKMISLREVLMRRRVSTAIFAPLIVGNQGVALLVLARSTPPDVHHKRSFTRANLVQAQDFAEQAAIAFTNAHLYQQIREAHRQLQELDQLKDQFMITASHELRTPLTSVQGYLELLAQFGDSVPPEQQKEFLQKARRGCDELVLLLSNVMDASRLEVEAGIRQAYLERVTIHEVVTDVITLIEPQVNQEKREVHLYIPDQLQVKADPARLRQVLLNLGTNALKYSSAGTPLAFTARAYYDQRPSAVISISDKGKGIKAEDQAQVFQRFVRLEGDLNSSVRGSGLGLYISRRLVEAMDGRIWVESSGIPGNGSTFYIQLPLA